MGIGIRESCRLVIEKRRRNRDGRCTADLLVQAASDQLLEDYQLFEYVDERGRVLSLIHI